MQGEQKQNFMNFGTQNLIYGFGIWPSVTCWVGSRFCPSNPSTNNLIVVHPVVYLVNEVCLYFHTTNLSKLSKNYQMGDMYWWMQYDHQIQIPEYTCCFLFFWPVCVVGG